jgi:hypothetical protein
MNVLRNWIRSLSSARRSPVPRPRPRLSRSASSTLHTARLRVEALEARYPSFDTVNINDQSDNTAHTVFIQTIDRSPDSSLGMFGFESGVALITWDYSDTSAVNINLGPGDAIVNVVGTGVPTNIFNFGAATVNVGNAGSVQGISGTLFVANVFNQTTLNVDDSADSIGRNVTWSVNLSTGVGSISGLAADGVITYPMSLEQEIRAITVFGGSGSNTFTINGAGLVNMPTTLSPGAGNDTVSVQATFASGPLTLNAGTGSNTVNLGNSLNRLDDLRGPLTVNGQAGTTRLNVNDQGTAAARTYTVTPTTVAWGGPTVSYTGLGSLTVNGGAGGNTLTVVNTAPGTTTTINGGAGVNTFFVKATAAGSTTNLNGSADNAFILLNTDSTLNAIQGNLNLTGSGFNSYAVLHDGANAADQTYVFTADTLNRTRLAPITYHNLRELFLVLGSGNNCVVWQSTAVLPILTLDAPVGGNDTLVGPDGATNRWQLAAGASELFVNGRAAVDFPRISNLVGGSGNNTFQFSDGYQLPGSIVGGGGTNTLDYTAYSTSVIVDLQTGFATGVGGPVSDITAVLGGTGNGALGAYNLLIGGAGGGDTLTGGLGRRNLLVAGGGASTLHAGDQEDLLIGGTTMYDTEAGLVSWLQIASYWAGTDPYATRVFNLTHGIGVPRLDASTVTGNGGGNTMNGTGALALLYTDGLDNISGFDPGSQTVPIAP